MNMTTATGWHPTIQAWQHAPGFRPLDTTDTVRKSDVFWRYSTPVGDGSSDTGGGDPPIAIAIGRPYDGTIPARRKTKRPGNPSYLGIVDPNDLLNGKIPAYPGDTFLSESIGGRSIHAFIVQPDFPNAPGKPHENFRHLFTGLTESCLTAALAALTA